jgi:nitrogen regulatory protein PII
MSFLVVLIVDDPEDYPDILTAWEGAGVTGVTILESSGLGRFRQAGMRENLPLKPSLHDFEEGQETHHRTLLSVVDSQEKVNSMVAIAKKQLGNLNEPHSGFLFVVPVLEAYGLGRETAA